MPPRNFPLFPVLLFGPLAALLANSSALAADPYYWDTDDAGTAGFGTAGGTWGTSTFWGTDAAGSGITTGATITTADSINFGTATAGLGAGTITGPGTAEGFLSMTFGSASGAISLSGGTLNLGSSTGSTITVNNASNSISTVLQGSGGKLTKAGTGTLILSGINTFSGGLSFTGSAANNIVVLKNSSALGTGPINLYGGVGSIRFDNSGTGANIVFSNAISLMSGSSASAPIFVNVAGDNKITSGLGINTGGSNTAIQVDGGTLEISGNWGNSTTGRNVYLQGAGNGIYSGIIQFGNNALNKAGAGTWTLTGANTYTGTTSISGGTLKNGSATTFTNKGALSMSSTGTFDLGGFNASVTNVSASTATNTIVNNGSADATLTISNHSAQINALIKDGASNKLAVNIANANSAIVFAPGTTQNTFSGGLKLTHNSTGTRLRIGSAITTIGSAGAITSSPFGRGAITIGEIATDKAQVLIDTVSNNTLANDIIINTANGTDVAGSIRIDTTGNVLSGTLTANLANARFAMNSGASANVTGKITGPLGIQVGGSTSIYNGTLTLSNSGNDYAGPTILTIGTLKVGASNGIPNGPGKGNVVFDTAANSAILDINGFDTTINGLAQGAASTTNIVVNNALSTSKTLTIGSANTTSSFAGVLANNTGIGGTLALAKTGNGTLTLSGANTYTGATAVTGGKLLVNGSSSLTSSVTVASGAGLGGSGTVGGATVIQSGAKHTAADGVTLTNTSGANTTGKQTFLTGITYDQGSIFEWNLTANIDAGIGVRENQYDAVNTASLATTGTGAIFRIVLNGSQNFSEGFWNTNRVWTDIFTNVNGDSNRSIASIFGGGFEYYNASGTLANVLSTQGSFGFGTGPNANQLIWTAVPEPTSALAGLLITAGLLRRRRVS